ncbi:LysR substrate-binding domain-containing protein [Streptomyces nodosus]|uniref:LysR substrate-binding domain-containing protein n=1 Tax=Streptomyces nodosus TaxID=40318 RepID=UPI0034553D7A
MRRLEDTVGHALFTRGPRGVGLTPAGREFLPADHRATAHRPARPDHRRRPAARTARRRARADLQDRPDRARIAQHTVEWQTVCALVETGLGVSLVPADIRRLRRRGLAFRGIGPGVARTRVAVAWRRDDPNPLVVRLLAAVGQEAPTAVPKATPPVRLRP